MNPSSIYSKQVFDSFFILTVLVTEGERCEVIGFIKKGECLLRRHIKVAHTFPNGKKAGIRLPVSKVHLTFHK